MIALNNQNEINISQHLYTSFKALLLVTVKEIRLYEDRIDFKGGNPQLITNVKSNKAARVRRIWGNGSFLLTYR